LKLRESNSSVAHKLCARQTINYLKKISVFRKEHFNSAHRLFVKEWTDLENQKVFGKCSNPNYHGHNYEIVVKLTGEVDKVTGYLFDLGILSNLIKTEVLDIFDHKNLNLDVSHFENLNPTAENIALVIHDILRPLIDNKLELKIKLFETERNYVEYPAD
jgi:6-pyruvoyltetrahydropterin/6-carboxytetrahydropterin synthase